MEAVIVEEDKLQKLSTKALEQVDTQMAELGADDVDLEGLDVTGGDEELGEAASRDDVEDAPIVRFVNKILLDAIAEEHPIFILSPMKKCIEFV